MQNVLEPRAKNQEPRTKSRNQEPGSSNQGLIKI